MKLLNSSGMGSMDISGNEDEDRAKKYKNWSKAYLSRVSNPFHHVSLTFPLVEAWEPLSGKSIVDELKTGEKQVTEVKIYILSGTISFLHHLAVRMLPDKNFFSSRRWKAASEGIWLCKNKALKILPLVLPQGKSSARLSPIEVQCSELPIQFFWSLVFKY